MAVVKPHGVRRRPHYLPPPLWWSTGEITSLIFTWKQKGRDTREECVILDYREIQWQFTLLFHGLCDIKK